MFYASAEARGRFRDYLANTSFKGKIHLLHVHADDREENTRLLNTFFDKYPQVRIGIIFNSRAHFLGDYLSSERPDYPFKLLGYDVIEPNVRYLENGLITHLTGPATGGTRISLYQGTFQAFEP